MHVHILSNSVRVPGEIVRVGRDICILWTCNWQQCLYGTVVASSAQPGLVLDKYSISNASWELPMHFVGPIRSVHVMRVHA